MGSQGVRIVNLRVFFVGFLRRVNFFNVIVAVQEQFNNQRLKSLAELSVRNLFVAVKVQPPHYGDQLMLKRSVADLF